MGSRPSGGAASFDFEQAQDIINQAIENQKKSTKALRQWGRSYVGRTESSQKELDTLFGRSGEKARESWEQKFSEQIPEIRSEYEAKQKAAPNILDSGSYNLLQGALGEIGSQFTGNMSGASGRSASQLYQALTAPAAGFEAIANRPAFNKLYDPTYMELAKNPPTVRSDVDSMRSLYTYNV